MFIDRFHPNRLIRPLEPEIFREPIGIRPFEVNPFLPDAALLPAPIPSFQFGPPVDFLGPEFRRDAELLRPEFRHDVFRRV